MKYLDNLPFPMPRVRKYFEVTCDEHDRNFIDITEGNQTCSEFCPNCGNNDIFQYCIWAQMKKNSHTDRT